MSQPHPFLILLPGLPLGGVETQIASLVARIDRARFRPIVACQHRLGPVAETIRGAGVPVYLLSSERRFDAGFLGRLVALLRKERVRLILSHGFSTGVAARLAGVFAGTPVRVLAEHSTGERDLTPAKRFVNRILEPLATFHVAVAEGQLDYLVREKCIPRSKIVVISNGIDVASYAKPSARAATRAALGLAEDTPVAGILAALRPEKDHKTFLLAARFVVDSLPDARFLIVGDGPLADELRREVFALDLTRHVVLLGARRDIPEILSAFDVSVLASTDVETLPMAFLESMAARLPLIGTAVGGVPELIEDGVNGRLVRVRDAEGLAAAMLEILRDADKRRAMGEASQARVAKRYGVNTMIENYEALFERLLKLRMNPERRS